MNKSCIFFILVSLHTFSICAEDESWKLNTQTTAMIGNYIQSKTMNNQSGFGFQINAEKNARWGITAGLQSTRIQMPTLSSEIPTQQDQDNWLISGHLHIPSNAQTGRWTLQLDAHRINNTDKINNSDGVRALAPRLTWLSYTHPLKIEFSHATSSYRGGPKIQQHSAVVGFGFNNQRSWLELHQHYIHGLNPNAAQTFGVANTHATDLYFSQQIQDGYPSIFPNSVVLGLSAGRRIYNVDMAQQVVYNLPMINSGAASASFIWKLTQTDQVTLRIEQTNFDAAQPIQHNFKLNTLSGQYATFW